MLKPIFVIGPQRTGTTWIYSQLIAQRSGTFLDRVEKENYGWVLGKTSPDALRRDLLKRATGSGTAGILWDVNSVHFGDSAALQRIATAFPGARVVFVHRAEDERAGSVRGHQDFNSSGRRAIGYFISDELATLQSDFDRGRVLAHEIFGPSNCLELSFPDLSIDDGSIWLDALSEFSGVDLELSQLGRVNVSRSNASSLKKRAYGAARFVQKTRGHVVYARSVERRQLSKLGLQRAHVLERSNE